LHCRLGANRSHFFPLSENWRKFCPEVMASRYQRNLAYIRKRQIMRTIKHKATFSIFVAIANCTIVIIAALIAANTPVAPHLTSSPVQIQEKLNKSRLFTATRLSDSTKLALSTVCSSGDGLIECTCSPPTNYCNSDATYCWCTEWPDDDFKKR
jgi:hypothetical protein